MGVDHGLGGKDGVKSKERREKRAKRVKAIAYKAMTGGKRKEVLFNEDSRTEYLTGFGKRKQERRKYGLAMEVLKKNKAHKEMVKEQRNAFKDTHKDSAMQEAADNDERGKGKTAESQKEVSVYGDTSTVSMFGSTVSVVVDTSLGEDDDDDDADNGDGSDDGNASDDDNRSIRSTSTSGGRSMSGRSLGGGPRELTRFEKALKIAKSQMGKKKKHRDNSINGKERSKTLKAKVESSKLLVKALGRPAKGKKMGRR
mmetsp:Transcript_854/g.1904  ORF Transcript_854/g.1904 Transcript_854/m.1904 type:complete len:256 (+) Transcript_854:99-866(+)|eukprot:CAMPEP_0173193924 /NCGR_PEP_ID=MMETSP1141-20130122/14226_1 /TAXON_ID=483371 /ORGANISM="non described non described, Strain CCMP2298" /LENGTH=255 /DNA_ID=CAMNT_0014118309 /DNA_START=76 /DNA_END=843 /DNA_ORIENTATION=+